MKTILILCLFLATFAFADEAAQCRSSLLRVTVANNAITGVTGRSALHFLRKQAPNLQELLQRDYQLEPIAFPAKAEECDRLGVNCPKTFCQDKAVAPDLRKQLCFALPCPIFEGTRNVGKCNGVENVYGQNISFPSPVSIKKLRWEVKSVDAVGKDARLCFRINELGLSLATRFDFDFSETQLGDTSVIVNNITGELDQPKDICATATLDLSSNRPVRNLRIVPVGTGPFISDQVIRNAARNVRVSGISGYSQREIDAVAPELLPVLVHPLRQSLEQSIAQALGEVLELQVSEYLSAIDNDAMILDAEMFMSELSFAPSSLYQTLAFQECRELVLSGKQIPAGHACIGLDVTFFDQPGEFPIVNKKIDQYSDAKFFAEVSTLSYDLSWAKETYPNVVAESLKNRLLRLRTMYESSELSPDLTPEQGVKIIRERRRSLVNVTNFITAIEQRRRADNLFPNIEIQGSLTSGTRREVSLAIPGICSTTTPSSFNAVTIPNCPIQAFIDLNQFNRVLTTLWEKGRICNGGRGPVVPGSMNFPNGCVLPTDLISCKLNNAPQLRFDTRSQRFTSSIQLRNCIKNILPFGIFGSGVGGDFNITFSFKAKACHNGDFCIDQPNVNWTLIRGTEQGWLQDPLIRGQVTRGINNAINEAMSKSFRIPFASATSGFMSEIPLKAEGRTRSGAGYFGVCLKEDR